MTAPIRIETMSITQAHEPSRHQRNRLCPSRKWIAKKSFSTTRITCRSGARMKFRSSMRCNRTMRLIRGALVDDHLASINLMISIPNVLERGPRKFSRSPAQANEAIVHNTPRLRFAKLKLGVQMQGAAAGTCKSSGSINSACCSPIVSSSEER